MYTWKDIKLATLQKMFAADGSEIVQDESTKDYLAGMPYAANEGLQRLATAGKFIKKSIVLSHSPAKNLVPTNVSDVVVDAKDYAITVEGGKSYYFQFSGIGTALITGGDDEKVISIDSYGTYAEIKGNYANTAGSPITITFASEYPATVKNLAVYSETFPTVGDEDLVQEYGKYVKYDLRKIAPDFYSLFNNSIVYEGSQQTYLNTTEYYRETDHILILPRTMPGMYTIYYNAYPGEITIETEDDYNMNLDPEVVVLLPLYMASALYQDDDLAISTTLRNQFEVGLEALLNTSSYSGKEEFISEWV